MAVTTYDIWRCPACGIVLSITRPGPGQLFCGCTFPANGGGTRMTSLGQRTDPLSALLVDCGDYQLRVEASWQ